MDILGMISNLDIAWYSYFYNNPTPMLIKNLRLEFVLCNPAFYAAFNTCPERIIGKTAASFVDEETYAQFSQVDKRILNDGGYSIYNTKISLNHLGLRFFEISKFPLHSTEKEPIGVISVISDVTPLINDLHKARHSITELNSISVSNGIFMNLLTHDIKNSLNGCLGLTEILKEIEITAQKEDAGEIITTLYSSIKRTINLLNSILIWKNARKGDMVFEPITANVFETVVSALLVLEATRVEKNIKMSIKIETTEFFIVDVNMFKTIIRNLIANAYAFSKNNSRVDISYFNLNYEFHLQIKDEGYGMMQQEVEGIFNAKNKLQYMSNGTINISGIGLILVKEFVELHNGRIEIVSEKDKGTTITVIIPNLPQ